MTLSIIFLKMAQNIVEKVSWAEEKVVVANIKYKVFRNKVDCK